MSERADAAGLALKEWAVTCDALARGEQIMLLRSDRLEAGDGADAPSLPRETFWLYPSADRQAAGDVTDPYRDRIQALDALDRDDDRVRLQYAAAAEHVERIADPDRLMALDGHHTLNRSAVERRLRESADGLLFMVTRVYRRESAVLVRETRPMREAEGWVAVDEESAALGREDLEETASPVLSDERFLERKAELLQLSGAMRAM